MPRHGDRKREDSNMPAIANWEDRENDDAIHKSEGFDRGAWFAGRGFKPCDVS